MRSRDILECDDRNLVKGFRESELPVIVAFLLGPHNRVSCKHSSPHVLSDTALMHRVGGHELPVIFLF